MAYWYYAMYHNLKPFKLDDEDPLSIFEIIFLKPFSIATWHYVSY